MVKISFYIIVLLISSGCSNQHAENESLRQKELITSDFQSVYVGDRGGVLSVESAMESALAFNLDSKIAQESFLREIKDVDLQKLNALPDVFAKRDFIRRSNRGASSSTSALSGTQSLEPSFSTDKSKRSELLEANWEVLDAAIAVYKVKSSKDNVRVLEERYIKVEQNIVMDTFSAFWQAAVAQESKVGLSPLLDDLDEVIRSVDVAISNGDLAYDRSLSIKSSLMRKRDDFKRRLSQFDLASIELKSLISYPLDKKLHVVVPKEWLNENYVMLPKKSMRFYVDMALAQRPEVKEEYLNSKIAKRNVTITLLETFPGLNLIAGLNRDDNSFLEDGRWFNFSAGISQSITEILTLPARYKKAKANQSAGGIERQALIAAVYSQVYIGKDILERNSQVYREKKSLHDVERKKFERLKKMKNVGLVGSIEFMDAKLGYEISKLDMMSSYSELQSAFSRFINTVGYDVRDFYNIGYKDDYDGEGV